MSLITVPDVVPSRVLGVCRLLHEMGPIPRKTLVSWMAPRSEANASRVLDNVIRELSQLSLIEVQEDTVTWKGPKSEDLDTFTRYLPLYLLERIFVFDKNLAYALAWLLEQDLWRLPEGPDEWVARIAGDGLSEWTSITNDTRVGNFKHWAVYLGFARQLPGRGFEPDPTAILELVLPTIFQEEAPSKMLLDTFIQNLGKRFPVFQGGAIRLEVQSRMGRTPSGVLDMATSLALLHFQAMGLIHLETLSDASVVTFRLPGTARRYTHITWLSHA